LAAEVPVAAATVAVADICSNRNKYLKTFFCLYLPFPVSAQLPASGLLLLLIWLSEAQGQVLEVFDLSLSGNMELSKD